MSPKFYSYCCMLLALEDIFLLTDAAAKHQLVFRGLYSVMVSVMPALARMMMQQPVAEGADETQAPPLNTSISSTESAKSPSLRSYASRPRRPTTVWTASSALSQLCPT